MPRDSIGPETSVVDVTLTRSASSPKLKKLLRVTFRATFDTQPDPWAKGWSGVGHTFRQDIYQQVKFRPGETSKVIPLQVPPVPAGSWRYTVTVSSTAPNVPWVYNDGHMKTFTVLTNAEKIPPEVVGKGITAQGLTLTFSKDMDPSRVQDINSYIVRKLPLGTTVEGNHFKDEEPVALKAAAYDSATRTVTLIPSRPLDLAVAYSVIPPGLDSPATAAPDPHVLTDLNGNPCLFSIFVGTDPWTGAPIIR